MPGETNTNTSSTDALVPHQDPSILKALGLERERRAIEKQINHDLAELDKLRVGMDRPLVDSAGFPRVDLDLARVRTLRRNVARSQNDYKAIMGEIESLLHNIHGARHHADPAEASSSPVVAPKPFARIDKMLSSSPAAEAGLLVNDMIVQFGPITEDLSEVARVVKECFGREIVVKVLRPGEEDVRRILVVPRRWDGSGTLGCHLVALV